MPVPLTATDKGAGSVARPPRTTDVRQRNIKGMLKGTSPSGNPGGPTMALPNPVPLTGTGPGGPPTPPPGLANTLAQHTPGGLPTDPNALPGTITPENTLRDKRLGFGVQNTNVAGPGGVSGLATNMNSDADIRAAFMANIPQLNFDLMEAGEDLAQQTSALGRTGSGLFNRDSMELSDRSRAARESLLGNLSFSAKQADNSNNLQAGISNQNASLQTQALQMQNAQANAARQLQVDSAAQNHLMGLQGREDDLARQAMMDRQVQMMLLQMGFGGVSPVDQQNTQAAGQANASAQHGEQAGMVNQQLGDAASGAVQAFLPPPQVPLPPDITETDRALRNFSVQNF